MSTNRIQKLLFSEYCDFEDMVLVESPFAETTREGIGLRQVQLGLTPSKLVLATDVLPLATHPFSVQYVAGVDPDIETFELIAVYPIECVNLSVFHRRKRQSIKARFCNNKILYFELGGFERRHMFWNLWCEKVKFLNPEDPGSSYSETSVATSTTNSTLYLVSSKRYINELGNSQLWCTYAATYGAGDYVRAETAKWTDKHLYLGKYLDESPLQYTPCALPPTVSEFVKSKDQTPISPSPKKCTFTLPQPPASSTTLLTRDGTIRINRFSSGIQENCSTGLFLPTEKYFLDKSNFASAPQRNGSHFSLMDADLAGPALLLNSGDGESSIKIQNAYAMYKIIPYNRNIDFAEFAESAVRLWEFYKVTASSISTRGKHRRRYAYAPQPHFLYGLGPWNVANGERFSLQMKRAVSVVRIRRQPIEPELRLAVSRRQLVASISCDCLHSNEKLININNNTIRIPPKSPVLFFWTPEYWYRPRSARDAYRELQSHLNKIRQYHQIKDTFRSKINILVNHKRRQEVSTERCSSSETDTVAGAGGRARREVSVSNLTLSQHANTTRDRKRRGGANGRRPRRPRRNKLLHKLKPMTDLACGLDEEEDDSAAKETSLQYLKRILRMEMTLSAWDFDSSTLAFQLTLIDKELFLKLTSSELGVLIWQQSSKNAPNIGALIAFSHRISCLVVTEILKDNSEKIRARLVARFINTAEKCNKIYNFQSCRSVLCGLQSPPIYRLYSMWTYIRKRHASKYQIFERLCRLYRDPRLSSYQRAFSTASNNSPHMPFIGDIIAKLLDKIPTTNSSSSTTSTQKRAAGVNKLTLNKSDASRIDKKDQVSTLLRKILSTLRVWQTTAVESNAIDNGVESKEPDGNSNHVVSGRFISDHYKPLNCYEDNRQRRLNECVTLLDKHQNAVSQYNYARNELAREYLLKARYREDKDNFIHSFTIESPLQLENNYRFSHNK